jgi:ribonuclease P protein component
LPPGAARLYRCPRARPTVLRSARRCAGPGPCTRPRTSRLRGAGTAADPRGGRVREEEISEASVPAEQPKAGEAPRLPPPDVDPRRPGRAPRPPAEGAQPPVGLIWRIRERSTFAELRRCGRRLRRGPLTVTFLPDPNPAPPRVAYAIGRSVGSAVVRNRLRRRLRAIVRELAGEPSPPLRSGAYLISASPAAASQSYEELKASMGTALRAVGDHRRGGDRA